MWNIFFYLNRLLSCLWCCCSITTIETIFCELLNCIECPRNKQVKWKQCSLVFYFILYPNIHPSNYHSVQEPALYLAFLPWISLSTLPIGKKSWWLPQLLPLASWRHCWPLLPIDVSYLAWNKRQFICNNKRSLIGNFNFIIKLLGI